MKWFSRFATISKVVYRYGLRDMLLPHVHADWLRHIVRRLPASAQFADQPLPVRLRLALENLGPIFVKLGQIAGQSATV